MRPVATALFYPTRYENPKGLLFFLPSLTKEKPAENSLKAATPRITLRCLAETERGVDQRIRSREVEVISGDPGVNEGSSKDALTRQQAATSKKGPSTPLEGIDGPEEPQDFPRS